MAKRRYEAFHPDHEYIGQILIDFENAVGGVDVHQYFRKHGLDQIDPHAWYSIQPFLDLCNDIANNDRSAMQSFVSIGMKQVETAYIPPEVAAMPIMDFLHLMNDVYQMNCRGTDIGEIQCEVVNSQHAKLTFRTPQPDDMWYGVVYGYMQRLTPLGMHFTVYYDENTLRQDDGGEVTIMHVEWE